MNRVLTIDVILSEYFGCSRNGTLRNDSTRYEPTAPNVLRKKVERSTRGV